MFPGFVSLYKDDDNFIHLYFFPGIGDDNKIIYRSLDLSNVNYEYKYVKHDDKSVDYKFESKRIVKVVCTLIDNKTGNANLITMTI